jgi:hypothetical protein
MLAIQIGDKICREPLGMVQTPNERKSSSEGATGSSANMSVWVMKTIDDLALVYALLYFPVPIYWLVLHPAVNFWRRVGYCSFWVALPVWVFSGVPLVLVHKALFADRLPRIPLISWVGRFLG